MRFASIAVIVAASGSLALGQQNADEVAVQVSRVFGCEDQPYVVDLRPVIGHENTMFRVTSAEGQAIQLYAAGTEMPRPMSHRLLCDILTALGMPLLGVIIGPVSQPGDLEGVLWIEGHDGELTVRIRPGDAVAVALCASVPILAIDGVPRPPEIPQQEMREYEYVLCEQRDDQGVPRGPLGVELRTLDGQAAWAIMLGQAEADSIWLAMTPGRPQRSRIHDAIVELLSAAKITVNRIVIGNIVENTIMASLYMGAAGKEIGVDCRPSDALGIALRSGAPIYLAGASAAGLRPVAEP